MNTTKRKIIRFSKSSLLRSNSFRMVFIAPSECGKTTLIKYLLWSSLYKHYKYVFLIVGSPTPNYEGVVWPNCKWVVKSREDVETALTSIISFTSRLFGVSGMLGEKGVNIGSKVLVIMDDVSDYISRSSRSAELFSWGRNVNLSVICLLQRFTQLNTLCRENITHLVLFNENQPTIESLLKVTPITNLTLDQILNILHPIFQKKTRYQAVCLSVYDTSAFPISILEASSDFINVYEKNINILSHFYSKFMIPKEEDVFMVSY